LKRNLIIITYSPLKNFGGGIESWLIKFLSYRDALLEKYENIYIIGYKTDNIDVIPKMFQDNRIYFYLFDVNAKCTFLRIFKYILKTVRVIKEIVKYGLFLDLLSVGHIYPILPTYFVHKKHGCKIRRIVWLRSIFMKEINLLKLKKIKKFVKMIERFYLQKADVVIANGYDTRDFYIKEYNIRNIIVIPNAIHTDYVKENLNPFAGEKIGIGYIGRLYINKGIDCFIKSIDIYNRKYIKNNKEFIVIGFGEMEGEVISLANKYNNVKFLGKIDSREIFTILSQLDATVHLTKSNNIGGAGISNSLLESIFANNLIICWDNPIFRQIVNENNAYMLEEDNILSLVAVYDELDKRYESIKRVNKAKELKKTYMFSKHIEKFISIIQ
jgi:glycosyltransferase involved in cell wall biosynthesis